MNQPQFSDEEMRANYPYFRAFVMAKLKEEFAGRLEPPGDDLRELARKEGGLPLEAFLDKIVKGDDDAKTDI